MDLKSVLNEPTVARPRPAPPPQASHQPTRQQTYPPYNGNQATSLVYQTSQRERPSQPPPLRPPEAFAQTAGYNLAQSPSPYTSASTTSIHSDGPRSAFGSSSGQSQSATTRDVSLYNNQYPPSFVPSPASHSSNHSNQGPAQQYQHPQRPPSGFPAGASLYNFNVPQESSFPLNGPQHSSSRQFSPHASHPSLSGTPLGPPAAFQKASPQATHRAASYGLEHTRTHSGGSLGSQHGYEYSERTMSHHQSTPSRESSVRQYSYEREREKSMSVSPKTIPQPSPLRKASTDYSQPQMTSPPRPSIPSSSDPSRLMLSVEARLDGASPSSSITPRDQEHGSSPYSSTHQSPRPPVQYSANNAVPPARSSPAGQCQQMLKRTASAISGSSSSPQPPRKRSKRAEIPIFARSARPNKQPLRLIKKDGVQSVSHIPAAVSGNAPVNGVTNHSQPMQSMPVMPLAPVGPSDWEPSITGSIPYEDLTRYICDAIFNTIGSVDPPTGGAVFEIEAKLGEIHNIEEGRRLRLPVMTETIFDKHNFGPPTKFESSMNVVSVMYGPRCILCGRLWPLDFRADLLFSWLGATQSTKLLSQQPLRRIPTPTSDAYVLRPPPRNRHILLPHRRRRILPPTLNTRLP